MVVTMLKIPWATASCNSGDIVLIELIYWINMVNGDKTIINRTEPMTLNKTWKNAALLAGIDPPIEARTAVIVVPIFDPNKNGKAIFKPIAPAPYICWTIAIVAADDWIAHVRIVPPSKPSQGLFIKNSVICVNSGTSEIIDKLFPIKSSP